MPAPLEPTAAPRCQNCGTRGVPSFLVLSTALQYWRCPDCFRIWTTLRSSIEQHQAAYAQNDPAVSFRKHCPQCGATEVVDLRDVLHSERADYFRCRLCNCWWIVPVGQNGPATRVLLGCPAAAKDQHHKAG